MAACSLERREAGDREEVGGCRLAAVARHMDHGLGDLVRGQRLTESVVEDVAIDLLEIGVGVDERFAQPCRWSEFREQRHESDAEPGAAGLGSRVRAHESDGGLRAGVAAAER